MSLKFLNRTRSLQFYVKCFQIGNVWFKFYSYGELGWSWWVLLKQGLTHFGKRELEGHLGFAVAQEMLGGMNLFWHPGLFWTQLLEGCLFLHSNWNSSDVREVRLGKWKGKWKCIFHLDERLTRDGQDGQKAEIRMCRWASCLYRFPHTLSTFSRSSYEHLLCTCHCHVLGPWDPASNKVDWTHYLEMIYWWCRSTVGR